MASPVPTSFGLPPLPPGWTEHLGPGGQPYYYNAHTQESTYVRPLPVALPNQTQPKKKEKPLVKTPVPGTDWIRVRTTEGNVFYSHTIKKTSSWTVPDEIRDAVQRLEAKEKPQTPTTQALTDEQVEAQRVKREVQAALKRKAEEDVPVDELLVAKKAKAGGKEDEEEDGEEEDSDEDSEEEEWQREAAAQLAAEADEEKKRKEEEEKRLQEAAEAEEKKGKETKLNMPERVDLSIEEAKALFKNLLHEKDVNPLHPWDTSLPLFISDPRYVLLPSVSARKEAFDEYCRDRARELRALNVKKDVAEANPKEAFERLLKEEVKSTRASWTDFRRAWKKDRRFYGWGRDDREREKKFREYLKELGEKKRAAAQKAEADFFALLRESKTITPDSVWKEAKRSISSDPRYDTVGSSSLREELFNVFKKTQSSGPPPAPKEPPEEGEHMSVDGESSIDPEQKKHEKKERAVREREERVRKERDKLDADIGRSKMGLTKEEDERDFRSMLTDAIRDPQMTWDAALPQLEKDPRYTRSTLPRNQQIHLFHAHVGQLRAKQLSAMHALFESHAPSLATAFADLPLRALLDAPPIVRLGLDARGLEHEFGVWQRERTTAARAAFDEMLGENAFVEFWGRLGKIGGEGVEGGVKRDDEDVPVDEGEGGGGRVDMKALAANVDVREMANVLKNDKRYIMFDHVPEQRERWLRDYLANLSAPKLSVHVPT